MQPALGPAFWPGFIPLQHNHYCTAYCPLQAAFYGVICFRYVASALLGPGPGRSGAPRRPRASNSGRNALLIEHKPTTVASTRESVGLGCLLLVVGGWCGPAGSSASTAVACGRVFGPRGTIPRACACQVEVGHVGLVGELFKV
jgi:hypothetical protein